MPIFEGENNSFLIKQQAILEASAGTGKTYAIQTLYLRLLVEEQLTPDKILVVTFTKLSTQELKLRLRKVLQDTLCKVEKNEILPEYLQNKETKKILRWLKGSLNLMEKAKIFTIHGFCSYLLQKFRLDPIVEESLTTEERIELLVKDALRLLMPNKIIALWQKEILLKTLPIDSLIIELSNLSLKKSTVDSLPFYPEQKQSFFAILEKIRCQFFIEEKKLCEDLKEHAKNYKNISEKEGIKPNMLLEMHKFAALFSGVSNDVFFEELFYFEPGNAKKKQVALVLHYPDFLEIFQKEILPFLKRMHDPWEIYATLGAWVQKEVKMRMEKESLFFYDDLLVQAHKLIQEPLVREKIQAEFGAALIDEFQDTDSLQWEIFSTLFINSSFPFYAVGDPKQSIYRFRQADLYTYFSVKNVFKNCYSLEKNYRTGPKLLHALNELFSKVPNFLELPQLDKSYSCPKVLANPKETDASKLIFWKAESEEQIFLLIQNELKKIQERGEKLFDSAILVKDHYQLKRLQKTFDKHLTIYSENREPLEKTKSFFIVELLIKALLHPGDREKVHKLFLSSLFDNLGEEKEHVFAKLCQIFEEQGLLAVFRSYITSGYPIILDESSLIDIQQLIVEIEKQQLASCHLLKALHSLKKQQTFRAVASPSKDGIRVMTIHMSKGLEFDYLFPVALIAPFSAKKELFFDSQKKRLCISEKLALDEKKAEKMRLFYVAMTRAKKQLFLPFLEGCQKNDERKSLVETFFERRFTTETLEEFVKNTPDVALFDFVGKVIVPTEFSPDKKYAYASKVFSFFSRQMSSFSSQVDHESIEIKKTMPLFPSGKEVGSLIHSILEKKTFTLSLHQWQQILEKEKDPFCVTHRDHLATLFYQASNLTLKSSFSTFTLAQLDQTKIIKESSFWIIDEDVAIQGVVDLTFYYNGRYYLLDYKSNHLDSYDSEAMKREILTCKYFEQGAVYQNAFEKVIKRYDDRPFDELFGGFFFLFLRGPSFFYVRKF